MPYGTPVEGQDEYMARFGGTVGSDMKINVSYQFYGSQDPTQAEIDEFFQAAVDALEALPGLTFEIGFRKSALTSAITPTPEA